MNAVKIRKLLFDISWIVVSACVAAFFVIALCVYAFAEPSGVSELLTRDGSWHTVSELSVMFGDLEEYAYVTKVYEYSTNNDSIDICWVNDSNVWRESIPYGVVVEQSAEHNYRVECFVYSDIADKQLIKRTWGVSVTVDDAITLAELKTPYFNWYRQEIGDIKKATYNKMQNDTVLYDTFIRITVKSGYDRVEVKII